MALDRNKTLQSAEKFVRQGKIEQAIGLYLQLIDANPKDMNLKNKVGDLYVRAGDEPSAIGLWSDIGAFYADEGFYLKAIALYKKINKLDTANVDCYYKLADLYTKQGLKNDAKSQYQQVADLYIKEGQPAKAAAAIEKMLEFEPDNIKMRIRLSEMQLELGQRDKGLDGYALVGGELAAKGMLEEALKIYEKGLQSEPAHGKNIAGLCKALFDLGRMPQLIDRARTVYPANKENVALLSVLAEAYLRTQNREMATQVFEKLAGLEPDNATWKQRLQGVPSGTGPAAASSRSETRPAPRPVEPVMDDIDQISGDFTPDELEQLSGEWAAAELAPGIGDTDSGVGLAPGSGVESERDEFIVEHMTEAEVFIKYGLVEKAIDNLEAIVDRFPDEAESLRRLKDLYLETGNKPKAAARCVDLARLAKARGEMPKAMDLLAEARAHDANVDVDRPAGHGPTPAATSVDDAYSFSTDSDFAVPVQLETETPRSGVDLDFGGSDVGGTLDFPAGDDPEAIEFDDEVEHEPAALDFDMDAPGTDEPAGSDGVEFFDAAIRPDRREISGEPEESLFEQESSFLGDLGEPAAQLSIEGGDGVGDDSLDAIFKEFKKGVDAQLDSEDYETHYNLGIAYREMELVDEAIAEFQLSSKDPNRFIESCSNLGLCFREKGMPKLAIKWYQKALEKLDESSPQYVAIIYDLAEGYEESGDNEKALETFTDVYGLDAGYRDIAEKMSKYE